MISSIDSFVLHGIQARTCRVEASVSNDHRPSTTVVGLPDVAVRESIERVRSAITSSGYPYPFGRIVVNLAPASLRKEGSVYDLPIALALLAATGILTSEGQRRARGCLVAGELALDGQVRSIRGVVSMGVLAHDLARSVIVPVQDAATASLVGDLDVRAAACLSSVVNHLNGDCLLKPHFEVRELFKVDQAEVVLEMIKGQEAVKRSIIIAAAGWHNLLMLGPPGCGKTLLARALPGLLPPLGRTSQLELLQIQSCAGLLHEPKALSKQRPVRTPHHTASGPALVGGGTYPQPGEASLAHHGVLFLDEMPEFDRRALETLRQPLEEHAVTIARVGGTIRYPARFLLVAAANPTSHRGQHNGRMHRVSAPMLDRIDLHVEVRPVPVRRLREREPGGPSSLTARANVATAIDRQESRQGKTPNGLLSSLQLDAHACMTSDAEAILVEAVESLGLSARGWDTLRRIARTIADLDNRELIERGDVLEAVSYRLLDRVTA